MRKATIERIREKVGGGGGTSYKLFWEDLKGKKKQSQIQK